MRRLAHISDLHFGRTDARVVRGLLADLAGLGLDLVCITGDLTQRARISQFEEARAFIRELVVPHLVVPGNHDLAPLYLPLERVRTPLARYQRYISNELAPCFSDPELVVVGANTARSGQLSEGRLSAQQLETIAETFKAAPSSAFKVLCTHHPFLPPPAAPRTRLVGRVNQALRALEHSGVDLLLAGHLHRAYTGDVRSHHRTLNRSVLVAQASTATSTRLRKEANAYNVITVDGDAVDFEVRAWDGDGFSSFRHERYRREHHHWRMLAAPG